MIRLVSLLKLCVCSSVIAVFFLFMNIVQGTFLPLVIPPTISQTGLWSIWLTVLCSLKVGGTCFNKKKTCRFNFIIEVIKLLGFCMVLQMFQALARDRLERLNASPSATPWTYLRVYSALLLVLSVDFFWYSLVT